MVWICASIINAEWGEFLPWCVCKEPTTQKPNTNAYCRFSVCVAHHRSTQAELVRMSSSPQLELCFALAPQQPTPPSSHGAESPQVLGSTCKRDWLKPSFQRSPSSCSSHPSPYGPSFVSSAVPSLSASTMEMIPLPVGPPWKSAPCRSLPSRFSSISVDCSCIPHSAIPLAAWILDSCPHLFTDTSGRIWPLVWSRQSCCAWRAAFLKFRCWVLYSRVVAYPQGSFRWFLVCRGNGGDCCRRWESQSHPVPKKSRICSVSQLLEFVIRALLNTFSGFDQFLISVWNSVSTALYLLPWVSSCS